MSLSNDSTGATVVHGEGGAPPSESAREIEGLSTPSGRAWSIVLTAGIVSGLFSFGIGEVTPGLFPPNLDFSPEIRAQGSSLPQEIQRRRMVANDHAAALTYGGLGLVLGLTLGAAGGVVRRSFRAAIAAGLLGLLLGGSAGAATTVLVLPSFHDARAEASDEDRNTDLGLALRTHGAIWLAIGAAAGLAFGCGLGGGPMRVARATTGGLLGAAVAAIIYEFAGALVFPLAETFQPLAKYPIPRLMAHLAVTLCVAAGSYWAVHYLRLRRTNPPNAQ
jgi:hypothetical protein